MTKRDSAPWTYAGKQILRFTLLVLFASLLLWLVAQSFGWEVRNWYAPLACGVLLAEIIELKWRARDR